MCVFHNIISLSTEITILFFSSKGLSCVSSLNVLLESRVICSYNFGIIFDYLFTSSFKVLWKLISSFSFWFGSSWLLHWLRRRSCHAFLTTQSQTRSWELEGSCEREKRWECKERISFLCRVFNWIEQLLLMKSETKKKRKWNDMTVVFQSHLTCKWWSPPFLRKTKKRHRDIFFERQYL